MNNIKQKANCGYHFFEVYLPLGRFYDPSHGLFQLSLDEGLQSSQQGFSLSVEFAEDHQKAIERKPTKDLASLVGTVCEGCHHRILGGNAHLIKAQPYWRLRCVVKALY